MSKYTTQLRYILEEYYNNQYHDSYADIKQIIEKGIPFIFDFEIPLEVPKGVNKDEILHDAFYKILRHFYTREIGSETYGLFKLRLEDVILSNVDYLNRIYRIAFTEIDPLAEFETTEVYHGTGNSTNDNKNTHTDKSGSKTDVTGSPTTTTHFTTDDISKYSDTPEGALTGVKTGDYLTNATNTQNDQETKTVSKDDAHTVFKNDGGAVTDVSNGSTDSATDYERKTKGRNKSAFEILRDYRETFFDIDNFWYSIVEDCFLQIW